MIAFSTISINSKRNALIKNQCRGVFKFLKNFETKFCIVSHNFSKISYFNLFIYLKFVIMYVVSQTAQTWNSGNSQKHVISVHVP